LFVHNGLHENLSSFGDSRLADRAQRDVAARVIRPRAMRTTSSVTTPEGTAPGLLPVSRRESRLLQLTVHDSAILGCLDGFA
jgi:hypothetical protein